MNIKTLFGLLCILACMRAWTITPIEIKQLSKPISGNTQLRIKDQSGSVNKENYLINTQVNFQPNNHLFSLQFKREYGTNNSLKNTDESFYHIRHIYQYRSTALRIENFLQYEQNAFKSIAKRTLLGFGFGSRKHKKDNLGFSKAHLFAGVMYETEHSTNTEDSKEQNARFTLSAQTDYRFKKNRNTQWIFSSYVQPKVTQMDDIRATLKTQLKAPLSNAFSLSIQYEWNYDSRPFLNVSKNDRIVSTAFIYEF